MAPEVNLWPLRGRSMQDRESELRRTPLLRTRVNKVGGCPRLRYAVRSNWRTRRRPRMHAAWYERCGPANEVLMVGEMEAPRPGPGEVLVRLRASGINPGDAKKRADWMGFGMGYARVIPHSDGAGTIEEVGAGGAGAVGSFAVAFAKWAGATVITTVGSDDQARTAREGGADHALNYRTEDVAARVGEITGGSGVDRIVEVAFGRNLTLDTEVIALHGVIASYSSEAAAEPKLPYWPLRFKDTTIRLIGSDDLPGEANRQAVADITTCLETGVLRPPRVAQRLPLVRIAEAHEAVEGGQSGGRLILDL